jgi:hypothetical protein
MLYNRIIMQDQPRLFEFDGSSNPIDAVNKTDRELTPEEKGEALARAAMIGVSNSTKELPSDDNREMYGDNRSITE